MNHKVGGMGQTQGKAKTTRAKVRSSDTTTHARSDHPLANSRSPS